MSGELTPQAIAAAGLDEAIGDALAQPHQVGDALWRIESAGISRRDLPGGVAVCGEEAIGGDLAMAALGDRATAPVRTARGFALEPWTREDTLVLCASYSGDGEEALACFEDAGARGAPRVVVTTGGRLAARARDEGVPVVGVPAGLEPGSAAVYVTLATLECAALAGAGPSLREEVEAAVVAMERVGEANGPNAPDTAPAKATALRLRDRVPTVRGTGPTAPIARRWSEQMEAMTGWPAFWRDSWHRGVMGPLLPAIFLDDPAIDDRLRIPIDPSATVVRVEGGTLVGRVLSLVMLGDFVAIYMQALKR